MLAYPQSLYGSDSARASFRSGLSQPSQMGNFRHQSIRTTDRTSDKDLDRERERDLRDREGQERLRNVSVHSLHLVSDLSLQHSCPTNTIVIVSHFLRLLTFVTRNVMLLPISPARLPRDWVRPKPQVGVEKEGIRRSGRRGKVVTIGEEVSTATFPATSVPFNRHRRCGT